MSRRSLVGLGVRTIAAVAVATTLATGVSTATAAAQPPSVSTASDRAEQETNTEQKAAAARAINVMLTPAMATMTDRNFTIELWQRARLNSHVKAAAEAAFTSQDPMACHRFITAEIFTANDRDIRELAEKAERDRQRVKAAAVVGWTSVPQANLDSSLADFVHRIWAKAEAGSEVRTKAAAVLTESSTDAQRTQYLTVDIFTADEADKKRRREEAEREERQNREKAANIAARERAWAIAAQAPLTENLKIISDHEFVYKVLTRQEASAKVKAAAQTALDTGDAAKLKAFIFEGIHAAHQAHLAEQNEKDALETARRINEILDSARRDGFQPNLVAAAQAALDAQSLAERHAFLNTGRDAAAKKDLIEPSDRLVVQLQGTGSSRCLQVLGLGEQPVRERTPTELWDCVRGPKMVWELHHVNDGEYFLKNLNSKQCLDVAGDDVAQFNCDASKPWQRWKFIRDTEGRFQLKNVGTGLFAGAFDHGKNNATRIVQQSGTGAVSQLWRVVDLTHRAGVATIEQKKIQLKGVQSGRCLQTAGLWDRPGEGALANLAPMEIWECAGGSKMTWDVIDLGKKRYALKNALSGKCLDVRFGDHANDTPLVQADCHFGGTQQFVFNTEASTTDGLPTYSLENALTGKPADVINNEIYDGSRVATWDRNGKSNQRWTVVSVS